MKNTTVEPPVKRALMSLLKRGAITVGEAAQLAKVTEQAVRKWVDKERWDMKQRREVFVVRQFNMAMGANLDRQKSKRELRQEASEASAMWEWRHGEDGLEPGETKPH